MNVAALILAALNKVAAEVKAPVCEITLSHKAQQAAFQHYTIQPLFSKVADPTEVLRKQMSQAKLCVLGKQFRASLTRIGAEATKITLRFEIDKKPRWTIEYPARALQA